MGRLLIPLILCTAGVLKEPLLYLSLYLKENRSTYYALLDSVRREGDWEGWLEFFLSGVRETAEAAVTTAKRLMLLFEGDQRRIQSLGRQAGSALRVHDAFKARPVTSLSDIQKRSNLSAPTVNSMVLLLAELGIVREVTGRRRNRVYAYDRYLSILSEGTETP